MHLASYITLVNMIMLDDYNEAHNHINKVEHLYSNKYITQYLDQWQHKIE